MYWAGQGRQRRGSDGPELAVKWLVALPPRMLRAAIQRPRVYRILIQLLAGEPSRGFRELGLLVAR